MERKHCRLKAEATLIARGLSYERLLEAVAAHPHVELLPGESERSRRFRLVVAALLKGALYHVVPMISFYLHHAERTILTDGEFRDSCLTDPERCLSDFCDAGIQLTARTSALISIDTKLWISSAERIDDRLQKASLKAKPEQHESADNGVWESNDRQRRSE
jgi:hypothetical protein